MHEKAACMCSLFCYFAGMKRKLPESFYLQNDVCSVARQLLGKELVVNNIDGFHSGIITETEAYAGISDRASHAFNGRRTKRTETMYCQGGTAYVYLCYGVHCLFNVVTNARDIPDAVLIRSVFPLTNLKTQKFEILFAKGSGPGRVSKILGIDLKHNRMNLTGETLFIRESSFRIQNDRIEISKRIGIDYAAEDANRPYRFYLGKDYLKTIIHNV